MLLKKKKRFLTSERCDTGSAVVRVQTAINRLVCLSETAHMQSLIQDHRYDEVAFSLFPLT